MGNEIAPFCMHGLEDRRASDHVYATRLGSNYLLRQDCNAPQVCRALSLGSGGGRSRTSSMSRGAARTQGLDPCRICVGRSLLGVVADLLVAQRSDCEPTARTASGPIPQPSPG